MNFSDEIIQWYNNHKRDLPWRHTQDPYKIWLSEIILQQTRVDQGRGYYDKFIDKYPTVKDLASASEEDVLNMWQGLGYYSRARNLHTTAKYINNQLKGKFPKTFQELIKLKGVGNYTAAAIASFSYNEKVPVVDGNVYRVLSRCFKIDEFIDTNQGQKYFFNLATQLIKEVNPAEFNQAIMEFGALHCTPKNPKCEPCIFRGICETNVSDIQHQYPKKKGKTKVKPLYLSYLVFATKGKVIIRKRKSNSIWANLYDFPCVESNDKKNVLEIIQDHNWLKSAVKNQQIQEQITYKHLLSHRRIYATFYWINKLPKPNKEMGNIRIISMQEFDQYPVSKLVDIFWHHFSKEQAIGKE